MDMNNSFKRDIFISYRREGGDDLARMLYLELSLRGYSVFYDLETLENGKFNEALYWYIEQCTDFLLILPPNSLERCQNQDDWVRLEIAHALKHKKNIIPVMLPGFQLPKKEQLPEDMRDFVDYNGVNCSQDKSYYTDMVDRIVEKFLDSQPTGAVFGKDGAPFILQKPDADCTILLKDHFRCPKCGAKRIRRDDGLDQRLIKMQPWIGMENRLCVLLICMLPVAIPLFMVLLSSQENLQTFLSWLSTVPVLGLIDEKMDLIAILIALLILVLLPCALILNALEDRYTRLYNDELREGAHTVQGVCENCNTKFLVISQDKKRENWTPPEEEE